MKTKHIFKVPDIDGSPVRDIKISSRSITGTMPDGKRYESSLERDLMILLNFDPLVHLYTPQPLSIRYQANDGSWRRYTPDGLIEYRTDIFVHDPRPVLVEVKYRKDFRGKTKELIPKIRAARKYAKENGWLFEIYTEDKIRTPFLDNVRFLTPYLHQGDVELMIWLTEELAKAGESTPKKLTSALYRDKWNQAILTTSLWALIARRDIGCDLAVPLNMNTKIWAI
jgi:hypothetical protein